MESDVFGGQQDGSGGTGALPANMTTVFRICTVERTDSCKLPSDLYTCALLPTHAYTHKKCDKNILDVFGFQGDKEKETSKQGLVSERERMYACTNSLGKKFF